MCERGAATALMILTNLLPEKEDNIRGREFAVSNMKSLRLQQRRVIVHPIECRNAHNLLDVCIILSSVRPSTVNHMLENLYLPYK